MLWLDNLATRVPGSTVILIATKMDLVPPGLIAGFEDFMTKYTQRLFHSEIRFRKIKLGGIMFVSSNPKFKDFKKSKLLVLIIVLIKLF